MHLGLQVLIWVQDISVYLKLTYPLCFFGSENLFADCIRGCFVVACTLCAFISLVWLREQIVMNGGPDWLEPNVVDPVPQVQGVSWYFGLFVFAYIAWWKKKVWEHFLEQVKKKKALYLSVNVFSTKVLIGDTIFLRLLMETGPPFYVVIRATRRSSLLQCKGSTFISRLF